MRAQSIRILPWVGLGPVLLCGCQRVGPDNQLVFNILSTRQENQLGEQAYQKVLGESKISSDAEMTAVVRRVGQRIAAAARRPDFDWEFNLIESEQVNAFCLPGGKIAVYTGILPIMENEAAMAVVLGHEVGHALYRHGGQRVSQGLTVQLFMKGAHVALGDSSPATQEAVLGALGAGAQYGIVLPHSRDHELQADEIGLQLAAEAGYDPREAVPLWERMAAVGGKRIEFASTHPSEERRIIRLNRDMPQAMQAYERAAEQHGKGVTWGPRTSLP